jgi:hypothetical protein
MTAVDVLTRILIYLTGIPLAYYLYKQWRIKDKNRTYEKPMPWTVGERKFAIFVAICSWIGVFIWFLMVFTSWITDTMHKDNDKIAKW